MNGPPLLQTCATIFTRRTLAWGLAVSLGTLLTSAPASSAPIVDYEFVGCLSSDCNSGPALIGTSSVPPIDGQAVAQTFTVSVAGVLDSVDVGLYKAHRDVATDIDVFVIDAAALAAFDPTISVPHARIPIVDVPYCFGACPSTLVHVDLASGPLVAAGNRLAVVLNRPDPNAVYPNWVVWQLAGASPAGEPWYSVPPGSGWRTEPQFEDLRLRTWVRPLNVAEPPVWTMFAMATTLALGLGRLRS